MSKREHKTKTFPWAKENFYDVRVTREKRINDNDIQSSTDFWADSASISILEEIYNFKIIILESDNYHNGEYSNILQCGDMVPDSIVKSNEFKPYYYIIVDHNTLPIPHYQLIQYDSKSIFRFHEIPYYVREMIKNKCTNSKSNLPQRHYSKIHTTNGWLSKTTNV